MATRMEWLQDRDNALKDQFVVDGEVMGSVTGPYDIGQGRREYTWQFKNWVPTKGHVSGRNRTRQAAKNALKKAYRLWLKGRQSNPRGGRTMARRTTRKPNARAADRWGVYVKSQLAYVSTKKLDANKAASRLQLSGRANISIKPVGPNPISGIVPKVGWRAEFKKAAYSAMKAPGVRRKRARTTSKIRQTRQRRGENPKGTWGDPRHSKWQQYLSAVSRAQELHRQWIGKGETDLGAIRKSMLQELRYDISRGDRAGVVREIKGQLIELGKLKKILSKMPNPAGPSSRAVAGRIGRAVGARVKSHNPKGPYTLHDGTGKLRHTRGSLAEITKAAKILSEVRKNYNDNGYTEIRDADGKVVKSFVWTLYGVKQRNPRSAGVGTRSVMRGSTFRGAVGRKRNSAGFYKVWFSGPAGETAGVVVTTDKYPKGKTSIGTYSRLFPFSESPKMRKFHVSKVYPTFEEAFRHPKGPASSGSGPRKRNAPSILRRRNPTYGAKKMAGMAKRGRARRSNPQSGYAIQSEAGTYLGKAKTLAEARKKAARELRKSKYYQQLYIYWFPGGDGEWKVVEKVRLVDAKRREKSKIVRRSNPRTSANPSSGYVVQVGNTVAWVGKLAADAQKAMRKLMAGGRKGVKGFAAKLPVGIKRGWRSQFKAVSRKRNSTKRPTVAYGPPGTVVKTRAEWGSVTNAKDYVRRHGGAAFVVNADGRSGVVYTLGVGGRIHERKVRANASFGKGKLGSGSRFKSCVRTMKRRGVASPSGLCASIGRRKYGAKRMARMAKRGRAWRSNPRRPVIITTTSDLRKGQVIEYRSAAGPKRYARVKRAARADETRSVRSIESGTHRGYVVQPIKAPK